MIIDTYCLVFTLRLIMRLIAINFFNLAIKNFNCTAALVILNKCFHRPKDYDNRTEPTVQKLMKYWRDVNETKTQ